MTLVTETATTEEPAVQAAPDDASGNPLDELRLLLVGKEQTEIGQLHSDVADLRATLSDQDAMAALIAPSLDEALRNRISQSRDEMVEVLYPIIGSTVVRAVGEAVQDLARNVDSRLRSAFSPAALVRRMRAQASGVSRSDLTLRDALPFDVVEMFLIHRQSGLLLRHLSLDGHAAPDSDLVSGMLTAIRDFASDAFGRGDQGELDTIEYGGRRILIEAAQHVYLAVVGDGVEPAGFRAAMRDAVIDIESRYRLLLREYNGDATPFAGVDSILQQLATHSGVLAGVGLTRGQKRVLAVLAVSVLACSCLTCLAGWQFWQRLNRRSIQIPTFVILVAPTLPPPLVDTPTASPTATATASPTATAAATPTATATLTPTATPSPTATPTPTRAGFVDGVRLNVREGPGLEYPVIRSVAPDYQFIVSRVSENGDWLSVCCLEDGTAGWVSALYIQLLGLELPTATAAP